MAKVQQIKEESNFIASYSLMRSNNLVSLLSDEKLLLYAPISPVINS